MIVHVFRLCSCRCDRLMVYLARYVASADGAVARAADNGISRDWSFR